MKKISNGSKEPRAFRCIKLGSRVYNKVLEKLVFIEAVVLMADNSVRYYGTVVCKDGRTIPLIDMRMVESEFESRFRAPIEFENILYDKHLFYRNVTCKLSGAKYKVIGFIFHHAGYVHFALKGKVTENTTEVNVTDASPLSLTGLDVKQAMTTVTRVME